MMHNELTAIAAERSPEKRLELLHRVTDLYFEGVGQHTSSESYLFNEIMERIVDMFSRDLKREVSASLAILPDFPSTIVRKLATDEDFVLALLDETGVALVHGAAFGLPGHFRLSYAASDGELTEAVARVQAFAQGVR